MRVQLKKVPGGKPALACVRADGTRTWSKLHPFFPIHDLTHYSVESVFGFTEAFFGLIASGWEIDAFARPGAASKLPPEALLAECLVGLFDLERGTGQLMTGEEISAALGTSLDAQGLPAFRAVTQDELARVRALRGTLTAQWAALANGKTLDLTFPGTGETVVPGTASVPQ